jgi:hypothetical protein
MGIARTNKRIDAALKDYPRETWSYEELQRLDPGCSDLELRAAEQRHIERLRSWMPEYGFNLAPAVWGIACPEQREQFSADVKRQHAESAKQWREMIARNIARMEADTAGAFADMRAASRAIPPAAEVAS